ncbi:MAG: hypothetical protein U0840_07055 [Gemmataceae bacterium]
MVRSIGGLILLALFSGALWLSSPVAADQASDTLEVGFAERDVTPRVEAGGKPVWLAGFGKNRKATGVHDPLLVRALVVGDGKNRVALASVDVVGLFIETVDRIRHRLPGFAHVVISSTHNHEGPDTMGIWGPGPFTSGIDPEYQQLLVIRVVEAIQAADRARKPASARIGTVKVPELLHDGRKPLVLHDDLAVLTMHDPKSGKPSGMVVQWNCHPETLADDNKLVSADYVGYTVNLLQKKYNCPVVYFTGTVGGLMTSLHVPIKSTTGEVLKDGTYEKTARYGELLAEAAIKAEKSAKAIKLTPVVARKKSLFLPLTNRLYVVARQFGVFNRDAFEMKPGDKAPVLVKEIDDPKKPYLVKTEVGYVGLGELNIACIPGEIYPELVLGKVVAKAEVGADYPDAEIEPSIYAQMKGPHRMLLGLANDEIGYIIPKRQWDEKPPFAYDTKRGQYGEVNSLGPETAPLICNAFRDLLRSTK